MYCAWLNEKNIHFPICRYGDILLFAYYYFNRMNTAKIKRVKISFPTLKKRLLILMLIIALGSFLRLFKFMETFNFGADAAYAYILAKRIIEDKYILLLGPITSLHGVNILAPTYYYIITLLYFIFRGNEVLVTLIFTLAGIMSLYLIYLVGKELFNAKTGLLAALLMAV